MAVTRRPVKLALIGLGALALVGGAAATARAYAPEMRAAFMKRMVSGRIDAALDAIHAAPAQRAAIHQSRDRIFDTIAKNHQGQDPAQHFEQALALFQADRIQPEKVQALRDQHLGRARVVADAVTEAIHEAHDSLTPQQRQELVAYLRTNLQAHAGRWEKHGGQKHMQKMVDSRIDGALDAANATPEQRAAIKAIRDQAHAQMKEQHSDHQQMIERAAQLFLADRWDAAAVAAFRGEQEARMNAAGDALLSAVTQAHGVLSPEQRQAVVAYARSQHEKHQQHRGWHHGGDHGPDGQGLE
jgi:Spy/CpxP family protein refolding chaperone